MSTNYMLSVEKTDMGVHIKGIVPCLAVLLFTIRGKLTVIKYSDKLILIYL